VLLFGDGFDGSPLGQQQFFWIQRVHGVVSQLSSQMLTDWFMSACARHWAASDAKSASGSRLLQVLGGMGSCSMAMIRPCYA
jgi:hypothetical protein